MVNLPYEKSSRGQCFTLKGKSGTSWLISLDSAGLFFFFFYESRSFNTGQRCLLPIENQDTVTLSWTGVTPDAHTP